MGVTYVQQTATRVREAMAGLGVHLRQDWITHCLQGGPAGDDGGRRGAQQSEAQEEIFRTFLACDLREAGEGCLPAGVGNMVKERVKGKMVLQVKRRRLFFFFDPRPKSKHAQIRSGWGWGRGSQAQSVAV